MAQNITSFYRVAQTRDFARQFQFRLVQFGNTGFTEDDLVYVETASLPGRTINNVPVSYMGLDFNIPGTAKYPGSSSYSVTFRCDQRYNIRNVIEQNTFRTFNDNTSTGDFNTPSDSSVLIMQLIDKDMSRISEYTLFGVYVQTVGDTAYNISDSGSIVTVPVTLAYQFWRKQNFKNTPNVENTRRR